VKCRISSSRPSSSGHDRNRLISASEKNLVDNPTPPARNDQRRAHPHQAHPPATTRAPLANPITHRRRHGPDQQHHDQTLFFRRLLLEGRATGRNSGATSNGHETPSFQVDRLPTRRVDAGRVAIPQGLRGRGRKRSTPGQSRRGLGWDASGAGHLRHDVARSRM
jgi:hypothetical protein